MVERQAVEVLWMMGPDIFSTVEPDADTIIPLAHLQLAMPSRTTRQQAKSTASSPSPSVTHPYL